MTFILRLLFFGFLFFPFWAGQIFDIFIGNVGRLSGWLIVIVQEIDCFLSKITGDFLRSPTYLYREDLKPTDVGQLLLVEINRCHDAPPFS